MTLKKQKQNTLISIIYLVVLALSFIFARLRGIRSLQPFPLLNVGVDLFGMIAGTILVISCRIDVTQPEREDQKLFLCMLNAALTGLFTDLIAWVVNEVPSLRTVNLIDNTIYYMVAPVGCYFFWKYVTYVLRAEERWVIAVGRGLQFWLIISLIVRVINLFTGFYFTVDASGVYARSTWYPISMAYLFFTTTVTFVLILIHRKKLRPHQIVALLLYVTAPTLVGIVTMAVYGLSLSYGVITLVLLLMYCVLNIAQSISKAVADRDLAMAAEIQHGMLPHDFPPFPQKQEFDLYATMNPAREVGGDFYDFFLIDDDHLCMVIADVSGKGVPAALFMMTSKTILQSCAMLGRSAGEILTKTNEAICSADHMEMFVTVWLGILEISTGRLTAANAGHEYPALMRSGGLFELYKDPHGIVIGGMEGIRYREYEIQLNRGDRLFLYTDGVPEATNSAKKQFGTDRMLEALNIEPDVPPKQILENVRYSISKFVGKAEQFDDVTMLCLEYKAE